MQQTAWQYVIPHKLPQNLISHRQGLTNSTLGALALNMFPMKQCNNSFSYEVFWRIINVLECNKYITYCGHRNSQHLHAVMPRCRVCYASFSHTKRSYPTVPMYLCFWNNFPTCVSKHIKQKKPPSCSCQCARWRCVNKKYIVGRVKGMWCHAAARCNIPVTLLLLKPQILLKKPNHFKANTYSAETMPIPSKLTTVIMLLICAQTMSGLNMGANTYSSKWQVSL